MFLGGDLPIGRKVLSWGSLTNQEKSMHVVENFMEDDFIPSDDLR